MPEPQKEWLQGAFVLLFAMDVPMAPGAPTRRLAGNAHPRAVLDARSSRAESRPRLTPRLACRLFSCLPTSPDRVVVRVARHLRGERGELGPELEERRARAVDLEEDATVPLSGPERQSLMLWHVVFSTYRPRGARPLLLSVVVPERQSLCGTSSSLLCRPRGTRAPCPRTARRAGP